MIVPVQIGPDGGIAVEIFATAHVPEHCALSGNDEDRLAIEPVAHLRERVPEIRVVELSGLMHAAAQGQNSILSLEKGATSWLTSAAARSELTVERNRGCQRATV